MDEIVVRRATAADAPGITNVHVHSWQETYRGLLPDRLIDRLPLEFEKRLKGWVLDLSEGSGSVFVADHSDYGIIGFAKGDVARDEDYAGYGELSATYLLKAFHGNGIGYRMLENVFAAFRTRGLKKAYCWVLQGNAADSFYERTGAESRDTMEYPIEGDFYTKKRMVWDSLDVT